MKRDMDLIRKMLFEIEKAPFDGSWVNFEFEECVPEQIAYHTSLLVQAGLVRFDDMSSMAGEDYKIAGLTWNGHEFLKAGRNDQFWNQAKRALREKGLGMVFSLLNELLLHFGKEALSGMNVP